MRFFSKLFNFLSSKKNIEQPTSHTHLIQIHAFILKTSLDHNNFVVAKFLHKVLFSSTLTSDHLRYAREVFDKIPQPDTFIFNTMIRGYLKSQNFSESLYLFTRMQLHCGGFVDSFSLSLILQLCGRLVDCTNGKCSHSLVLKLGFGCDLFVQTALVDMYAKVGLMDVSREMFDEMKDPDLVSCNVMLAEYVKVGEIGMAQDLFDRMGDRDLVSWNTMIHGYASLGDLGSAPTLFSSSRKKYIVSWSSMISNYSKSRQSNDALRLFHKMQLSNVVPDKITMVSVLCACGDVGALGMGKMVHEYIKRNKIKVDMKLGTSLVDMYAKCGDIDNALLIFHQMSKKDVFSWSAMLMGLANHGFGEAALDLFSKMILEGVSPNDITFIGVLTACSHIGLVDKGWNFFNSMSSIYGITPKIEHYGNMIDILGRSGRLQEARGLIRSMPFEPDAVVWRALLGACGIHKNVELAEEAAMQLISLKPNEDGNFVLLSNVYSRAELWNKVINVRKMIKSKKIQKVPGSSLIEVNNTVYEFIAGDKSHLQSHDIYQTLIELINRAKQYGCCSSASSVLQDLGE